MPKKLIIISHGVAGSANSCWIQWIKSLLTSGNTEVITPSYPNASDPEYPVWKDVFNEILANHEYDELLVIGHSLGGFFTLKILGDFLFENPKLKGVVLVAPTSITNPQWRRFYAEVINWDNIRKVHSPIKLLFSNGDSKISVDHIKLIQSELRDNTNFEFRNFQNLDHFMEEESNEVLDAAKSILN
ncbi:hypothetical protein TVAG_038020 [Trichomonas vaginalis G3]|uniref:AB hydrolase-1 domain-containing protein n=1 Tax=Trichomonas vaginalis (strain ATCC PRA-98 / G3) TaxID=412133 RepID=A2DXW0_TRIV3|nr:alpha/beta hydrolase fold family [Trichomonas vaginalis G3]EAY14696.1 hypothetical protein TVAG_038020 [Trichomonas vaginalis G3]KAI5487932.1 alpha/beta hydrolase fold family [Trichomonas vaginalis G3]|eukprot:XP_001326919.1 hypothetical protein [Trichomonas vaginalis G3]